jgi:uncharacterized protein YcfJ
MPSANQLAKENESLQRRLDSKDDKLERVMSRGMFVGGAIGGAAIGALIDLRIPSIWGFKASSFLGAVGIGLVLSDKVPKKHEETILALSLGMVAQTVYTKTQSAAIAGGFKGLFGG